MIYFNTTHSLQSGDVRDQQPGKQSNTNKQMQNEEGKRQKPMSRQGPKANTE